MKAIGVEYEVNGTIKTAYLSSSKEEKSIFSYFFPSFRGYFSSSSSKSKHSKSEVVVTAGAIMTPKLLMNSGIGPRKVLESAGINVRFIKCSF
jgi:hypothetical protein